MMDMFCYVTSLLVGSTNFMSISQIMVIFQIAMIFMLFSRLFGISQIVKEAQAFAIHGSGNW